MTKTTYLPGTAARLIAGGVDRLTPVLVRAYEGRFTCPLQDVEAMIAALTFQGWTIRDAHLVEGTA